MSVVIYSDTCPKCRFIRYVLGLLNVFGNLKFLSWNKAKSSILLNYFENESEVPYNFMLIEKNLDLHIGGPAIPLIMIRLWEKYAPKEKLRNKLR